VTGLIPEIVVELHAAKIVFPTPDDLKIFVQMQKAAGRVALGVAEHGDDDIGAQAMDGVRGGQIGFRLDLIAGDDLMHARGSGIGATIHDMQIGRAHPRYDQITPLLGGVVMA